MSKKERIEDLGRLSTLLNQLYSDEIFDTFDRPKYASEVFFALSHERQYEMIETIAYGLERIHDQISECCCIADGTDDLNTREL